MTSPKIGFVLLSNSRDALPSTRISVLHMMPFLRAAGFDPHIVYEPAVATRTPDISGLVRKLLTQDFRIVYFQKVGGPSVEDAARQLSAAGIRTVHGMCDLADVAMAEATDVSIVVTSFLKSLYPEKLQSKIHVVHDGIENPSAHKTDWGQHAGSWRRPLRAVLVTSSRLTQLPVVKKPPRWLQVSIVGDYAPASSHLRRVKEIGWAMLGERREDRLRYLGFLLNRHIRCVAWGAQDVYLRMQDADIGIIPVEAQFDSDPMPSWKLKSENRLTLKMSVGLPVIASPIPSYEAVIDQGVNGFLAASDVDWVRYLEALRDPAMRRQVGQRARAAVYERFSKAEQAKRLIHVLRELLSVTGRGTEVDAVEI